MSQTAGVQRRPQPPCRVLIADDSKLVRTTIARLLLAELKTLMICGEATDGRDAVAKVRALQPDIVLLDLSLPLANGLEVVRALRTEGASCTWVLMSEQDPKILESIAAQAEIEFCLPKMQLATAVVPMLKTIARRRSCSVE